MTPNIDRIMYMRGDALTAMGQEFQLGRKLVFGMFPEPDFRFRKRLIRTIRSSMGDEPLFTDWDKRMFYFSIMVFNILGAVLGHLLGSIITRWIR